MKRTTRRPPIPPPLALALLGAGLAAHAAVPVRWTVETSRAAPVAIEQFAGTSIDLEAALKSYGSPLDVEGEPRLYWQTNGMGSAWWSAPASASGCVLRAAWTPACEAGGAASYRGFIGIPGSVYSAAFTLRLRPSPGAVPNALPLPAPRIDFAAVEVANAPWVEEESDPTVPAWAKAAKKPTYTATEVGAYTKAEADAKVAAATPADYEAVSNLAKSAVQPTTLEHYAKTEDLKAYVKSDLGVNAVQAIGGTLAPEGLQLFKGWNSLIGKDTSTGVFLPLPKYVESNPWGFATLDAVADALTPYAKRTEIQTVPAKVSAFENDKGYLTGESDPTVPAWAKAAKKPTYTASEVGAVPTGRKVNGKALSSDVTLGAADVGAYTKAQTDAAISSATGGLASVSSVASVSSALEAHEGRADNPHGVTAAQVGAYTKDEADEMLGEATGGLVTSDALAGVQTDVSTLNVGYARLYNFATGATNANFSATNYPPTAADAATRCHYRPEAGMDFSTVPASLQLNENRDGTWRTVWDSRDWTVWYFRFRERQLTNDIARLKAENASLSNRLEQAKAWADRTANGVENPMSDTLVVDRPNMWLMAGYEWQKCVSGSNQCFVIRAKDVALSGGSNTNGFLEICDAFGKPYMRVNKSAETFADPVLSDISFDAAEGAWHVVFGNAAKPTRGGANCELEGGGGGKRILYAEDDPDCPATITWPTGPDSHAGHWIMKAVPKPVGGVVPSRMFFGAEIKVPGKDYVEYVKEASFGAGIRVGNNVYDAVESGNTLIWTKRND